MKHCIDCKYFSQKIPDPRILCTHENAMYGSDMVTGAKGFYNCQTMRESGCGKEATLFEPTVRNNFLAMLKNWFMN